MECGHRRNPDFNAAEIEGVGWNDLLIKDGRRVDLGTALIDPLRSRDTFKVLADTVVTRLLFDQAGSRVRGVEYAVGGKLDTVIADQEVIVCAGAVASPRLLLLSGIGPAAELEKLGSMWSDLPGVGKNLHDHLLIGVVYEAKARSRPSTSTSPKRACSRGQIHGARTVTSKSRSSMNQCSALGSILRPTATLSSRVS